MFRPQQKRSPQEQNIISSIHSLTSHCLNNCTKSPLESIQQMRSKQLTNCFAQCTKNVMQMRFKLKDMWMQDMALVQQKNQKTWKSYLEQ